MMSGMRMAVIGRCPRLAGIDPMGEPRESLMLAKRSALAALAVAMLCLAGCGDGNSPAQRATDAAPGAATGTGPADAPSVDDPVETSPVGVPTGSQGAITLHVEAAFTSPFPITDSYDWTFDPISYAENGDDSPVPATCADLAKLGTVSGGQGNPPTFQTPTPPDEGTMSSGKNSLTLQAYVDEYGGPGNYTGADVDGTAGLEISNTPELPADDDGDSTFSDVDQTSSIKVNADGSGTTTIVGWQDAGGRTASGTLTWTCSG